MPLEVVGGEEGDFYYPGALDGSRPGQFYARSVGTEPIYKLKTIAYHEGIPGHHYQISIAQELYLPLFRKVLIFDVNNEYQEFATMPLSYVPVFAVSKMIDVRRITPFKCEGYYKVFPPKRDKKGNLLEDMSLGDEMGLDEMNKTLYYMLKNFFNGMILRLAIFVTNMYYISG